MDKPFRDWVAWETTRRDWSLRELARRAQLSHTSVVAVVSGQKKATCPICIGIAKAFDIPAEDVLRRAGILPPVPERAAHTEHLLHAVSQMSDAQVRELIEYAEFIRRRKA